MPAHRPLPTVQSLLEASSGALRGRVGSTVSTRSGGGFDSMAGPGAILWSAQAQRDQGIFRDVYLATASPDAFDRLVVRRYGAGAARVVASYGTGHATVSRPTSAAGAGTLYAGTRIVVLGANGARTPYAVATDTPVGANVTTFSAPVRALVTGTGTSVTASAERLLFDDVTFDATLAPLAMVVADGTDEESTTACLARARTNKRGGRVGYATRMIAACAAVGAEHVVIFDAGIFGDARDPGFSNIYVADANYGSSAALLDACMVALDAARCAGCDAQVLGMVPTPITVTLTVALRRKVSQTDTVGLTTAIVGELVDAFGQRRAWWTFDDDRLAGIVYRAAEGEASGLTLTTTPAAASPDFVPVLPRYTLAASDITLAFTEST